MNFINLSRLCTIFFLALLAETSQGLEPRPEFVQGIRKDILYPYRQQSFLSEISNNFPIEYVPFSFNLPFYGFSYNFAWISRDGFIAFTFTYSEPSIDFSSQFPVNEWPNKPDPAFIGPFVVQSKIKPGFGEADNANFQHGVYIKVYPYIGTTIEDDLQEEIDLQEAIKQDIQEGIIGATEFVPKHVIIVTWLNLTAGMNIDKELTNIYQVMIATDEITTYVIFNYKNIGWIQSGPNTQQQYPIFVGFNGGNGTKAFEYKPFSRSQSVLTLTTGGSINGHLGRHIFRVDEEIIQGRCDEANPFLVLSPNSGTMMGGTMVNISGPCFDAKTNFTVDFGEFNTIDCLYRSRQIITCVTNNKIFTGLVEVVLLQNNIIYTGTFYYENPLLSYNIIEIINSSALMTFPNESSSMLLKWNWQDLWWDKSLKTTISLWGFKETFYNGDFEPDFIVLDELTTGAPNNGSYKPDLHQFINKNRNWPQNVRIGYFEIKVNDFISKKIKPFLWSRPFPLIWFFGLQWFHKFGEDWPIVLCTNWKTNEDQHKMPLFDVMSCPCTAAQASVDKGRFAPDPLCDGSGPTNCYRNPNIRQCFRSGQPNEKGFGQHCCYGTDGNLLLNIDTNSSGIPQRSHPLGMFPYKKSESIPGLSFFQHDQEPYYPCCQWQSQNSESCRQFYKTYRRSDDCKRYQLPNAAIVFGDPHIITFDNFNYTFNGRGEFVLLRTLPKGLFEVQGRFQQFFSTDRNTKHQATVLTSVVVKNNETSALEIQLRPKGARYRLDVLINGNRIYLSPLKRIQALTGITVYSPYGILNQSIVIAMFRSGAGIEVSESDGFMSVKVFVPPSFKNATAGLLGTWSNKTEDDLLLPNGSFINIKNSFNTIHSAFALKWSVNESSSLFTYENQRNYSFYNDKSFQPDYNPYLNSSAATSVCGSREENDECHFDFGISGGNIRLARTTKRFADEFRILKRSGFHKVIRCPALLPPANGQKSSSSYTVGTNVKFSCDKGYALAGMKNRTCLPSGIWASAGTSETTRCISIDG